ncbi:putative leucine-rich repeat protein [Blattamonas nauphoetae]|uniref:Leucine-rich repeat protein n=1 Tax=Blattamonas nauphoetae TaxID=2049346 RepID=A0ABQ9YDP8_9EUKA|nr:putative leucine-rich repeat protein [Blattamonas nauphoetae]
MVRDGFHFDVELVRKVSKFLSSITSLIKTNDSFDGFLYALGQDSPHRTEIYVDSITTLLSSSHPSIFKGTLAFIRKCLDWGSHSNQLALVSSKLIPRIFSTPYLHDLSGIDDKVIMNDIITILECCVWLSSPDVLQALSPTSDIDPESVRDVVLHEVLIPMEQSLVQISRNPHFLSWNYKYEQTLKLLTEIFDASILHQPTLDFVCSSRIPMAYQTLLSKAENEYTLHSIIWRMADNINKWKEHGAESLGRGRLLLQILEQEGRQLKRNELCRQHPTFHTCSDDKSICHSTRSAPSNTLILFPVLHSLSLTQNQFVIRIVMVFRIKKCPLLNHPTLTVLDLSRNNISSIDKPLVVPTLTSLSLALNRLTSFVLPNGSHLPCLQILDLRMNYLETLDEQTFETLPTIKSLYLTSNELESLPDRLGDILPNLSTNPIDIFGGTNELVSCPDFLMRSTGDLRVYIPNNRLRTLPRLSCDVVVFSADSNRITEIEEDVFAWPSRMKSVSLKDNLILSLPKTLFTPTLTCLLLAHNLLTDLWDGLFTLPNMQTLDASFISLAIIPPSIFQLTSLVKVNFGFNKIKEVPNELFRIPTLTHLILSHNKLTSLPSDPAMSPNCELSLVFVDPLSKSMIYEKTGTEMHPGAVLCALERLLLASNQLASVPRLCRSFENCTHFRLLGTGFLSFRVISSAHCRT